MATTDYNKLKQISPTSQNDSGATVDKAQPVLLSSDTLDTIESGSSILDFESSGDAVIDSSSEVYGTNSVAVSTSNSSAFVNRGDTLLEDITEDGKTAKASVKLDNQQGGSADFTDIRVRGGGGSALGEVSFQDGGAVEAHDGTEILSSWSAGTIYDITFTFDFTNQTYEVDVNGTTVTGIAFNTSVSSCDGWHIYTESDGAGFSRTVFFDEYTFKNPVPESTTGTGGIGLDWTNISSESDIAVYDQNGNLLPYEIESFDATAETATLWCYNSWVRDDTVQAQIVYGDGPASSEENVTGTWNNTGQNIQVVYHSQSSSGNLIDSGPNQDDAALTGTTEVDGQFDIARNFDGTDDTAEASQYTNGTGTVSCWFKTSNNFGSNAVFITEGGSNNMMRFQDDNRVHAFVNDGSFQSVTSNSTLNDGEWHHAILVTDAGNQMELFIDGLSQGTTSIGTVQNTTRPLRVGSRGSSSSSAADPFTGDIDEGKFNNNISSSAWIQAEYDASPKAGQVFFSQSAAETTVQTETATFSQDISILDEDITKGFSQTVILENRNIPEQFSQDVAVKDADQTKVFDSDTALQDRNVEKTFTQDATLLDRDAEKTVSTDVSIKSEDQTVSFSQDIFVSAGNEEPFDNDVSLKAEDAAKQLSTDLIIENANIPEQFSQDVNIADRDVEVTFSQDVLIADLDNEETFAQDVYISQRMTATFDNTVVIAKQPAPDVTNPLTAKILNPTQTEVKNLNPSRTKVKVKDIDL